MQPLIDFSLEMTRWFQATYPQLEGFFKSISQLGIEEFYLAFLPLVYWCLDKNLGKAMAYLFLLSNSTNSFFKHALRAPRPYWLDESVALAEETSYGIPSGHVQLSATVYLLLASWLKRGWFWVIMVLFVTLMGLSRIYLGVHFVHDVVAGLLLAILTLLGYFLWRHYLAARFWKRILGQKLLAAVTVPIAIAVVYAAVLFLIGEPDLSVTWANFVPAAELAGIEAMATGVGALLGAGTGLILESSRVRFRVEGSVLKRGARYIMGIAVTIAIWAGLKAVFPTDPIWLAVPFRILRYFLILFWVSYYGPMVFVRLGLAPAEPDPGISLKL